MRQQIHNLRLKRNVSNCGQDGLLRRRRCRVHRKLWRRNFVAVDLDGVGHFTENALESDFIRRELLAQGNLEFCTLRTDRSLTRWTCPARNRAEFNFLTSTTPADAGASAVPSSAEEGSTAGMGVVLAYANETQKPKEKPLPFPFVGSILDSSVLEGGEYCLIPIHSHLLWPRVFPNLF